MEELDFDAWRSVWQKDYTDVEYNMRKTLFEGNKRKVVLHNAEYRAGRQTWWMALNELADWTPEEFATLRSHKYAPTTAPTVTYANVTNNPASIDWYVITCGIYCRERDLCFNRSLFNVNVIIAVNR